VLWKQIDKNRLKCKKSSVLKPDGVEEHPIWDDLQLHTRTYLCCRLVVISSQAFHIPTISKLRLLYDNYVRDASVNEHVTAAEHAEENSLLDSFMTTPVMKYTMQFLSDKGTFSLEDKVFWDVMMCCVSCDHHFVGLCCIHLQHQDSS
jgi:hypothetical protein